MLSSVNSTSAGRALRVCPAAQSLVDSSDFNQFFVLNDMMEVRKKVEGDELHVNLKKFAVDLEAPAAKLDKELLRFNKMRSANKFD